MFEKLVALRSSVAYAALGAIGIVSLLRLLISLEMWRMRGASASLQPDLVQRVLNRHGDSGLGLSPKMKLQLAIERLSERGRSLTQLLLRLVLVSSVLFVVGVLWLSPKARPETTTPTVMSVPSLVAPIDSIAPATSERAAAPGSQASPTALVFTLLSVKLAPGAGDFSEFRLTTFVNGFRNSYPATSPWADLKEPSLPFSFSVDLEKDYRIAFKGQLKAKNGFERAYTPQPVDVFEWRGRDEERVYASTAPLIIKYKIANAKKTGDGLAQPGTVKHD